MSSASKNSSSVPSQTEPPRGTMASPNTVMMMERLRKAIGHGVDHGRMMRHAAMAAFDLDALGLDGGLFHAALPGTDAVGTAEDRGGRHRWRLGEPPAEARVLLIGAAAAGEFINAPGIGRLRMARERAAKRDHGTHAVRHHLGELAGI